MADMVVRATLAALAGKFGEEMMKALMQEYMRMADAVAVKAAKPEDIPPATAVTADGTQGMRRGVSCA